MLILLQNYYFLIQSIYGYHLCKDCNNATHVENYYIQHERREELGRNPAWKVVMANYVYMHVKIVVFQFVKVLRDFKNFRDEDKAKWDFISLVLFHKVKVFCIESDYMWRSMLAWLHSAVTTNHTIVIIAPFLDLQLLHSLHFTIIEVAWFDG